MSQQQTTTLLSGEKTLSTASQVIQTTEDLQAHVRVLAALPESDAPVLSCYLHIASGKRSWESRLEGRAALLRQVSTREEVRHLDAALDRIRQVLAEELDGSTRGVAAFARTGSDPFFCCLQFQAPTPNWVSLDGVPNIYHLIELKDTFDRYVVLFSTQESARIFEVHLGAVTCELWLEQPELRKRVGREWTRLHYQNHRRNRDRTFVKEKVTTLERLMSGKGYSHLVLAGDPSRLAMIRRELPKQVQDRVVDVITAPAGMDEKSVVDMTLAAFVREEEREAHSLVKALVRELRRDGLAVSGLSNSLQVLRRGQADALLLAREWRSVAGWSCSACTWAAAGDTPPDVCADCGATELREYDAREELVRLAEQTGSHVEVVAASEALGELGGCGCLLRFRDWGPPSSDPRTEEKYS